MKRSYFNKIIKEAYSIRDQLGILDSSNPIESDIRFCLKERLRYILDELELFYIHAVPNLRLVKKWEGEGDLAPLATVHTLNNLNMGDKDEDTN